MTKECNLSTASADWVGGIRSFTAQPFKIREPKRFVIILAGDWRFVGKSPVKAGLGDFEVGVVAESGVDGLADGVPVHYTPRHLVQANTLRSQTPFLK